MVLDANGGPLRAKYILEQFHMHWGNKDLCGSEHTVCSNYFSAEVTFTLPHHPQKFPFHGRSFFQIIMLQLHIVFWNTFYESFVHAVDKPEGLFVLGVFLQVTIKKIPNDINCDLRGSTVLSTVAFKLVMFLACR